MNSAHSGLEAAGAHDYSALANTPVRLVALTAACFVGGALGLWLGGAHEALAIWPPAGIALAALVRGGVALWPGVWAGAFCAHLAYGAGALSAALAASGSALGAVVAVVLLNRFSGLQAGRMSTVDLLWFALFGVLLGPAVSALGDLDAAGLADGLTLSAAAGAWAESWLAGAIGALLLAPALLVWSQPTSTDVRTNTPSRQVELAALIALLAGGSVAAWIGSGLGPVARTGQFMVLFTMLWAALRFGLRGATSASIAAAFLGVAITYATLGAAGMDDHRLDEGQMWFYLVAFAVCALVAASIAAREDYERRLRDSLERQRLLVESSPICIHEVDLEGRIQSMNPAGLDIMGLRSEREVWGAVYVDCVCDADRARVAELFDRACGGQASDFTFHMETPRGMRRFASCFVPIQGGDGRVIRLMGLTQDVTERDAVEAELRSSLAEKELLLREVHHRVKNNLQIVSSLLQLQRRQLRDPRDAERLQQSQERVMAMAMVHQMLHSSLDLSRLDFGKYVTQLSEMLFETHAIDPDAVTLRVESDQDVWLDLDRAVPAGLILNELMSNALQHAFPEPATESEIGVALRHVDAATLCLEVSDNGRGIDAPSASNEGTLGMRLVEELTIQLHADIDIATSTAGTRVRVHLPLKPPAG